MRRLAVGAAWPINAAKRPLQARVSPLRPKSLAPRANQLRARCASRRLRELTGRRPAWRKYEFFIPLCRSTGWPIKWLHGSQLDSSGLNGRSFARKPQRANESHFGPFECRADRLLHWPARAGETKPAPGNRQSSPHPQSRGAGPFGWRKQSN